MFSMPNILSVFVAISPLLGSIHVNLLTDVSYSFLFRFLNVLPILTYGWITLLGSPMALSILTGADKPPVFSSFLVTVCLCSIILTIAILLFSGKAKVNTNPDEFVQARQVYQKESVKRHHRSKLFSIAGLVIFIFLGLLSSILSDIFPGSTPFPVKCYADSCINRDAETYGCLSEATKLTNKSFRLPSLTKIYEQYESYEIEVLYSSKCYSKWIRVSPQSPNQIFSEASKLRNSMMIYHEGKDGKKYFFQEIRSEGAGAYRTTMLTAGISGRACLNLRDKNRASTQDEKPVCTDFVNDRAYYLTKHSVL